MFNDQKNLGFTQKSNSDHISPQDFFKDVFRSVTPSWLEHLWDAPEISEDEFPEELTLKIADIDDVDSIAHFFTSKRKQEADPNEFVRPRPDSPVKDLTNKGQIAVIEDHNGEIISVAFSFLHQAENLPDHTLPANFTEIGTVLSTAKGLGLSKITVSALAQITRERQGEDHTIIAKVNPDNVVANALFAEGMAWDQESCAQTISSYYNSGAGATAKKDKANSERNFYEFGATAEEQTKDLLHDLKSEGAMVKREHVIPFIFDKDDFDIDLTHENRDPECRPDGEFKKKLKLTYEDPAPEVIDMLTELAADDSNQDVDIEAELEEIAHEDGPFNILYGDNDMEDEDEAPEQNIQEPHHQDLSF